MKNICPFSAGTSQELSASKKKVEELEALCASQNLEVSFDCVYFFIVLRHLKENTN
jgi:hypothetical protein